MNVRVVLLQMYKISIARDAISHARVYDAHGRVLRTMTSAGKTYFTFRFDHGALWYATGDGFGLNFDVGYPSKEIVLPASRGEQIRHTFRIGSIIMVHGAGACEHPNHHTTLRPMYIWRAGGNCGVNLYEDFDYEINIIDRDIIYAATLRDHTWVLGPRGPKYKQTRESRDICTVVDLGESNNITIGDGCLYGIQTRGGKSIAITIYDPRDDSDPACVYVEDTIVTEYSYNYARSTPSGILLEQLGRRDEKHHSDNILSELFDTRACALVGIGETHLRTELLW